MRWMREHPWLSGQMFLRGYVVPSPETVGDFVPMILCTYV